ncbi:uncharacterized protein DS421_11g329050 [Arachis hypogaea]|nr:uncharacterized protein DS421_11g329050 [Arachis hypogaea]
MILILFKPKTRTKRRRRTEKRSKTKLKRKEEVIRSKKKGASPLITLNLRSILAGTVVTINKNSSLAQAEVGHLSLEERPKL